MNNNNNNNNHIDPMGGDDDTTRILGRNYASHIILYNFVAFALSSLSKILHLSLKIG